MNGSFLFLDSSREVVTPLVPNDGKCTIELIDQKSNNKLTDRVYFQNEDTVEMTKISNPDLVESGPVPWRRTYGPALNGQIVDNWFFIGSLSLLVLYSLVNRSFAVDAKDYILSTNFYPAGSLIGAILFTYLGGMLKSKGRSHLMYWIPFALAFAFMVLSIALSLEHLFGYSPPLDFSFVAIASGVLLIEAILIWRYTTRCGRQAVV